MNKKFVYITLLAIILFLTFHYLVWNIFTYKILNPKPYTIGDLSRISYQLDSIHNRIDEVDLSKTHITYKDFDNKKIDIITLNIIISVFFTIFFHHQLQYHQYKILLIDQV